MASRSLETGNRTAEQRRERRVAVAAASPVAFGELYVRPYDENWDQPLPRVAQEILGFAATERRGVIIMPPEFLKTTMISQLYPLWLTARYAVAGKLGLLTGMLLSEEKDLAERNLGVIAWHIENNELLRRDFVSVDGEALLEPDPDEDKWTDSAIIVRRGGVSKDPTWQAKALKSAGVQGARLRHLIADDVVTPLTAHSPARQRESKHLWDTQFMRRVLEDGQAIAAGNFNSARDLLATIANRHAWAVLRRPSLHIKGDRSLGVKDPRAPGGELQLPERWSRARLLDELSASPNTFAPVHLLRTSSEGGEQLQVSWVTRITRDQVPRRHRRIIAVDPAPGAEVDPDPSYFTITVGCLSRHHLDVVESIAVRLETTEQVELLGQVVDRYAPIAGIAISKVALDRYFKGAVLIGRNDLRPFFHPVSIPGSKEDRLAALGAYAKSNWLRVVEAAWSEQTSGPDDRDQEETLGEQWANFPTQNHDDRLDGLDVLIRDALELGRGSATVVSALGDATQRGQDPAELAPGEVMSKEW